MRRVKVFLPKVLPGTSLNPNGNQKRVPQLVAEDKRQMRSDVCLGLLADPAVKAVTHPFGRSHLYMDLRWCKRWRWRSVYLPDDPSNAAYALKAAVDGLVDAGLLPDDSWRYVRPLSITVTRVETREEEGLMIHLTELEEVGE